MQSTGADASPSATRGVVEDEREWLQCNARGSYALGCADRRLRRKYHGLLTARDPGRGEPWSVLADVAEVATLGAERIPLSPVAAGPRARPTSALAVGSAVRWSYELGQRTLVRSVRLDPSADAVRVSYELEGPGEVELELTPLLRCRPWHELTFENPVLDGAIEPVGRGFRITPYRGMPALLLGTDDGAELRAAGRWWRGVEYPWEAERGYDAREDLFAPGSLTVLVRQGAPRSFSLAIEGDDASTASPLDASDPVDVQGLDLRGALERAAGQFLIRSKRHGAGIIAGYPWFGEWGRDTLLALPGLCLACDDWDAAVSILESLAARRVGGLVPNLPASGDLPPNLNSVDASLFFVRAVQLLGELGGAERAEGLMPVACEIMDALADAADPRVRIDERCGLHVEPGPWALTWMDAMVDGQAVTGRHGHAVEIDALMIDAARFTSAWAADRAPRFAARWRKRLRGAQKAFVERFWDEEQGFLADAVLDGQRDMALRPNQLFALGLLPKKRALRALARIGAELLTPAGLRTLSPADSRYRGRYGGDGRARDLAYHQGTVWPWLLGPYADAALRLEPRRQALAELQPVLERMGHHVFREACIGQVSEVFDGDSPHRPGGTPAQAWSVAEVYRLLRLVES